MRTKNTLTPCKDWEGIWYSRKTVWKRTELTRIWQVLGGLYFILSSGLSSGASENYMASKSKEKIESLCFESSTLWIRKWSSTQSKWLAGYYAKTEELGLPHSFLIRLLVAWLYMKAMPITSWKSTWFINWNPRFKYPSPRTIHGLRWNKGS